MAGVRRRVLFLHQTSPVLSGHCNAGQRPDSHCMQGTKALEWHFIANRHSTFWQKELETEFYKQTIF